MCSMEAGGITMCRAVFVSLALLTAPIPALALPPIFTVDGPIPFDL
jgi:hypothetical protein